MAGIAADLVRGCTDVILLRFLNEEDSYGYQINKRISSECDGMFELSEATLYTAFKRLEKNGYIRSYWGNEDTGARRRYYSITEEGRSYYRDMVTEWKESIGILTRLVEDTHE
jgi:DNA-binding PadR family transcriptional regulator